MENSIPFTNNIKTLMKEVMERLFCCCMMKKLFLYHMVTALCPQVTLSIKKSNCLCFRVNTHSQRGIKTDGSGNY